MTPYSTAKAVSANVTSLTTLETSLVTTVRYMLL